jgi:hypothetical protein
MLLGMPSIGVDACSHPIWISWIPPSCLLWTCPTTKVVKINVTWPFCVAHHINVSLDTRNNMLTFRLPPLQLLPKNKIWSPILWRPKIFGCQPYDNQNIWLPTLWQSKYFKPDLAMTKRFWSPNLQQPKNFNCHSCNNEIFSITIFSMCHTMARHYIK